MAKPKQPMKGVTSITKNGVVYWYARIDGEKKYCGKGDKGLQLATAAKAKDIAKRYENREIGAGLKVKKYEFKNVEQLSNWYMALPKIQEQKIYSRKIIACVHLLKYFGKMPINRVEGDDTEHYRQIRVGQGAAHGTVDLEIQYLRAMYNLALKRKRIPADAMPGEFVQKHETNPRRIITDDEFEKLLKHSDDDFKDFLTCGYESAMRLKEIRNLTPSQVHLDVNHISGKILDYIDLGIFDTKTGARRTVPVSPRLKETLIRRMEGLEPDAPIFTFVGKNGVRRKYYQVLIRPKLMKVCNEAGILYGDKVLNKKGERIGIVFHCLRHTRTTKWVEMGFSDEIIRRATGHKSLESYRNYVKPDPYVVMRLVENKNKKRDKNGIKTTQSL